jgi:hypothetical protein
VTTQELSRIAGGIAIVAVLVVSGMVAWSVLDQDADPAVPQAEAPRPDEATRLGDLTGYLGQVDSAGRTIVVAANPTGADPVVLAVPNEASVTVHGRQGGLGDLSKDMPVRVFYEVRNEIKHVTSIQVVTDRPQAAAPSPSETAPAADPKAAVEVKSPAESRPAPVPPAAQAKDPVESKPPAESRPPAEVKPAAPAAVRPTPPPPPATAVTPRPAPAPPATAPPDPPRAPATGPAGRDDDGSAAVDWLLKGPGRR